ncbi:alpha/beta fold hydrolase [Tropicibacter sp. Alg240-R139]|uniref:alpha/beta fold hydrolase n=1 Tax=Tropicibacter sp. Alg240-R139 TaxID=2305991 RepID=UPI0013E0AF17|nr:alpha/beta hydrolase [Tropicibacter sp. Alg240-R139]
MIESMQYSEVPQRAREILKDFMPDEQKIKERVGYFESVQPRPEDQDGDTETLGGVEYTHHIVWADGDFEQIKWHYVEAGPKDGEVVVFLHGVPDTWFMWHNQMSALADRYRVIGVDLKGYGQSSKEVGDYSHQGAARQLMAMLSKIGIDKFNLVTHDRGSVQGDYITSEFPNRVLRYGRGEQHLFHFHPDLAPQGPILANAPWSGKLDDAKKFAIWLYTWVTKFPIPDEDMIRVIQEFSFPEANKAITRYFNTMSFRQEWIDRRRRLLGSWTCPVLIMQGYDSKTQPREFYEDARTYIPNAKDVGVEFVPGGHFWSLESPKETTAAIERLLKM